MQNIIEDLNWRYATKKFDPSKKLTEEQLDILKESIRLSASSYGLQAYKVLIVEDPAIREKLMEASYGQRPVVDASHLIIFCAYTKVTEEDAKQYMELISETRGTDMKNLEGFQNGIVNSINNRSDEDVIAWTSKQTYIALGHLLHTCASIRVDSLPMEGFSPKAYNEILGLDEFNLTATLACPVGFRHEEDHTQHNKKVRKSNEDLFDLR